MPYSITPEFLAWVKNECKGIRILTLRNLVLFTYLVKGRMEKLDWKEWISRMPETRQGIRNTMDSYLSETDNVEIEYYVELLGWSPRLVFDYWKTLRTICILFT